MIQALSDDEVDIRTYAAVGLANVGEAASDAVPALIPILTDESDRVREHVAFALSEIGTPEAEKALSEL